MNATKNTNRENSMNIDKLKRFHQISIFRNLDSAHRWAGGMHAGAVMMGDAGEYWVTTMKIAARLERAGYEWA